MDLSIIIPSRNEMFISRTIQDILDNIEADTEIIAILDGAPAKPPVTQHERVNVIYLPKSIGQRAATTLGVKLSKADYVMKVDAHCGFDKGFDRKMIDGFKKTGNNVVMVPIMRNLHAFDWKCHNCGWTKYQGPTPEENGKRVCPKCKTEGKIRMKMRWIGKHNPQSTSYCFDSEPHFQYFEDYKHRPQYIKDKEETGFTETMSLQGSCFMMTRDKYLEFAVGRDELGSWGNEGIEIACKAWLSGCRVLCNHNTWYAHMFRTQGGDFGFPYEQRGRDVQKTKNKVKELFWNNKYEKQIYSVDWLVERFWPVPGWKQEDLEELKKH